MPLKISLLLQCLIWAAWAAWAAWVVWETWVSKTYIKFYYNGAAFCGPIFSRELLVTNLLENVAAVLRETATEIILPRFNA